MFKVEAIEDGKGLRWRVVNDAGEPQLFHRTDAKGTGTVITTFATEAQAKAQAADRVNWHRYIALKDWLTGIGVCKTCAAFMAIGKVESENGNRYDWKEQRGHCPTGASCGACVDCRQGARCHFTDPCAERAKRFAHNAPGALACKVTN